MDISEGDWSAQLNLDAATARPLASELLAAADQLSPVDKKQVR
jgi:hypothetical protein